MNHRNLLQTKGIFQEKYCECVKTVKVAGNRI